MKNEKKSRNSNIEMLRILCMAFIIMGHFIEQTGAVTQSSSMVISVLLGSGLRIAVNIFVLIGTWFMIDRKFNAARILKLYGNIWFYTVAVSLMLLVFYKVSLTNLVRNFFPFVGGALWYGSAYIALMLLAPLLNCILKIDKDKLQISLVALFLLVCVETMIRPMIDDWMSWILWFSYLYICVGYYKKYIYENSVYGGGLTIGVSIYICMCSLLIICKLNDQIPDAVGNLIHRYLHELFVVPNIMVAVCVFLFFIQHKQPLLKNEKIGKTVNYIAKSTFSVYVFHQVPGFYDFLWTSVLKSNLWINTCWYPIGLVMIVIILFSFVNIIDSWIRIPLERKWVKSSLFSRIETFLNKTYEPFA